MGPIVGRSARSIHATRGGLEHPRLLRRLCNIAIDPACTRLQSRDTRDPLHRRSNVSACHVTRCRTAMPDNTKPRRCNQWGQSVCGMATAGRTIDVFRRFTGLKYDYNSLLSPESFCRACIFPAPTPPSRWTIRSASGPRSALAARIPVVLAARYSPRRGVAGAAGVAASAGKETLGTFCRGLPNVRGHFVAGKRPSRAHRRRQDRFYSRTTTCFYTYKRLFFISILSVFSKSKSEKEQHPEQRRAIPDKVNRASRLPAGKFILESLDENNTARIIRSFVRSRIA